MFDIPLNAILKISQSTNLIEMSKSFKLKSGNISDNLTSLSNLKEKLFLYFKQLINNSNSSCPKARCSANTTNKRFFINNNPIYLMFNMCLNIESNLIETKRIELLKSLILFPRLFELSSLFEHTQKSKVFYELVGILGKKCDDLYVTFFKINDNNYNNKIWVYYEDESLIYLSTYYDMISYCIKNNIIPYSIMYKAIEDKYSDSDADIGFEQMEILEKYALSIDNKSSLVNNNISLRPIEGTLTDNPSIVNSLNEEIVKQNNNSINRFKRNPNPYPSTKNSLPNSSITNNTNTSSNDISNKDENISNITNRKVLERGYNNKIDIKDIYVCKNCHCKNSTENSECLNCKYSSIENKNNYIRGNTTTKNKNKHKLSGNDLDNYYFGNNILEKDSSNIINKPSSNINQYYSNNINTSKLINKVLSENTSYDTNKININDNLNNSEKNNNTYISKIQGFKAIDNKDISNKIRLSDNETKQFIKKDIDSNTNNYNSIKSGNPFKPGIKREKSISEITQNKDSNTIKEDRSKLINKFNFIMFVII